MSQHEPMPFTPAGVFAGLSEADVANLVAAGENVEFAADRPVFETGDAGDAMYVVTEGEARVDVGGRFHILKAGDVFGEMAILAPGPRMATVKAVTDLRALRIGAEPFLAFLRANPDVAISIMKQLTLRLREVEQRLDAWMA
jgi:CRP-like cAMP-binding protein